MLHALGKVQATVAHHHHLWPNGNMCTACICSAMPRNRDTWEPNVSDIRQLHCSNCPMIHWICDTKEQDETPSASLLQKIGTENITAVFCKWVVHIIWTSAKLMQQPPAPECEKCLERHGPNVWRMMSLDVACFGIDPQVRVAWKASIQLCLMQ